MVNDMTGWLVRRMHSLWTGGPKGADAQAGGAAGGHQHTQLRALARNRPRAGARPESGYRHRHEQTSSRGRVPPHQPTGAHRQAASCCGQHTAHIYCAAGQHDRMGALPCQQVNCIYHADSDFSTLSSTAKEQPSHHPPSVLQTYS